MIISKKVKINVTIGNVTHYRKLGYEIKLNCKNPTTLIIPVEHLSNGSHTKITISCDRCDKIYNVTYKDYINSRKNFNFDTCNKCRYEKTKITNNIRFGGNAPSCNLEILNRQKLTRIKKGLQSPDGELPNNFKKYKYRVYHLTRKLKKELFEKWDGFDYYDGEYIKKYFNLKSTNRLYPTVDHKIGIYYGFINNIKEEEISKLDNLVITKKWINSSKCNKDITLFQESFNKII